MNTDEFRPARQPANEANRLAAVKRTGLMDSPNTARFDIYTQLFRHIAGVPVSYTGLLDETRQYFLSENFTGCMTGAREVGRTETICQHALLDTKPYIVSDMRVDPVFKAHPLVTGDPHWVFWAGFPIVTREGYVLGTICAVDFVPRELSERQVELLKGLTAELALSIQMQTDQQELIALKAEGVLTALQAEGLSTVDTARGFLNLCMDRTVSATIAADLIRLGLAAELDGKIELSAKGRALKTGQGLGPAAYKAAASPLKNNDLLDAMFEMLDKGARD